MRMLRKRLPDSRIKPGGIRAVEVAGTLEASEEFHIVRCEKRGSERRRRNSAADSDFGSSPLSLLCGILLFQS